MKSVRKLGNLLEIDGQLYRPDWRRSEERRKEEVLTFRKIKSPKKMLKDIDRIAKELAPKLDTKEVVRNALLEMEPRRIRKVYNALFEKKEKPKVEQHHGCFEMEVGGESIPIR